MRQVPKLSDLKADAATMLSYLISSALAAVFLSAPNPGEGSANNPHPAEADSSAVSLPDIEVVAPMHANASVIAPQVLNGKQLDQLNAHNVADAIRYFSGVQIKDYGGVGGIKTVDIRSMGTNHLGVFYDGIQLGNAQNGQIDLGKFSLDNIEEIALHNGQKSDIFQSAKDFGAAGTVYLRTRRPHFSGSQRLNFNITMRTGSFGLANPSARLEWKISNRVSATVNTEFTYATGRYKFRYRKFFSDGSLAWDTTAIRRNGDIHAFRAEAGLFGRINEGHWHAKAYWYQSEKGIPGAIVNNVWKNSQRQWDRNFFVQGTWQKSVTSRYDLMVNAKYSHDYMRYLNPDTTLMYVDNHFRQNETYLSVANKVAVGSNLDIDFSADWQWNTLQSDLASFSRPSRNVAMGALAAVWHNTFLKCQASLLATYVADRSHHADIVRHSSTSRLSPALFLSCMPSRQHDFRLNAFFKQAFRMPTFNDLYYTDIGNASLHPENATQISIGAKWRISPSASVWRSVGLSADCYHNIISNKIIAVPKGNGQYRWMMMNIGKVKIWGTDINADCRLSLPAGFELDGRLSYTWQSALDYSDPSDCADSAGTYKGQIAYIPRHSGSASGALYWKGFNINYSFIYVGQRWHNSSNIPANLEQPWYTHDASIAWSISLGQTVLRPTLEVNNLLNQQYEVISNYPMPGRNFKFILQFDF